MRPNAKLHATVVLASAIVALVGAGGCSPPPPSEDAVLYYLRNARVHGGVRRAWPAGQAYVDRVLKADAALQKELALLWPLADPLDLWPVTDPRWQDRAAVTKRLQELRELAEQHGRKRDAALCALGDAIETLPAGLPVAKPQERVAFVDKVWTALAVDEGSILWPEEFLPPHLALFREVSAAVDQMDADRPGLALKDAQREANILGKYAAVKTAAEDEQAAWLRYAEEHWNMIAARLKSIDKHAQRWEYEWLVADQKNLKSRLEAVPKSYRAAADGAMQSIVDLTVLVGKTESPQEVHRLQVRMAAELRRREELLATALAIKTRVEQIEKPSRPGTEATHQTEQP